VKLTESKISALQGVLREYKRGAIEPDDLIEKISDALSISDDLATRITSQVFPEFSALKPEPSNLTLRSHMTSAWFLTLQALQHRVELPLKLFSIDLRFRREQREDPTHLRVHHSASCVVMNDELAVEEGEKITKALLEPLGFRDLRFVKKKVTSKYYAPGMEYEGFVYNPHSGEWIEIVDYGIYSPIALARYGLEHPVLNVGLGVERLAMIIYNESDVRRLVYPQFYKKLTFTDQEIARTIRLRMEPRTKEGKKIKERIISKAIKHKDAVGPCQFLVYEGEMLGKKIRVYIYESEEGATLLGAAAENRIFVYDGNIVGAPLEGMEGAPMIREASEKGVSTGIRYIDGVASLAAAKIEEGLKAGLCKVDVRLRMARRLSDINLEVSDAVRRFITDNKKRVIITGPIFLGVRAETVD
jgi:O-phosphoseryl-tRNA synthetase